MKLSKRGQTANPYNARRHIAKLLSDEIELADLD